VAAMVSVVKRQMEYQISSPCVPIVHGVIMGPVITEAKLPLPFLTWQIQAHCRGV
jgi:hypothetical protein